VVSFNESGSTIEKSTDLRLRELDEQTHPMVLSSSEHGGPPICRKSRNLQHNYRIAIASRMHQRVHAKFPAASLFSEAFLITPCVYLAPLSAQDGRPTRSRRRLACII